MLPPKNRYKPHRVEVTNLTQYGVLSDQEGFVSPANAFTAANNIAFEGGAVIKSGVRYPALIDAPEEINKVYVKDRIVYGCSRDKIWRYESGWTNISHTSTKAYSPAQEWFITELSNVLVFNNNSNNPVYLDYVTKTLKELPGWGVNTKGAEVKPWRAKIIRSFKNMLVAIDLVEDGVEYKQRIRWSDIALPNNPPPAWYTAAETSAGFVDLSEVRGQLVDLVPMGDHLIVYTTLETIIMTYVGGNDIFTFRTLFTDLSMVAPECAVAVNGGHLVVSSSDVVVHSGSSLYTSIADGKIKQFLFRQIGQGQAHKVKVQAYPTKSEVWIMYPTNSMYNNRAAVYNTLSATWSFRDLDNVTAAGFGVLPTGKERYIDNQDIIIDNDKEIIDGLGSDINKNSLFVITKDLKCWVMDEGDKTAEFLPCSLTKRNMDMDEYGLDNTGHKQISAVIPQFSGSGVVNISIGVSDTAQEEPRWGEPVLFEIGGPRKQANFRRTGRYISIKFESFGNTPWKLHGYSIEVIEAGTR